MSSKGSAHVELEPSEVEMLRIEVEQMKGESRAFYGRHDRHAGRRQEGQRSVGVRQRRGQPCFRGEPVRGRAHHCRGESSRGMAYNSMRVFRRLYGSLVMLELREAFVMTIPTSSSLPYYSTCLCTLIVVSIKFH